MDLVTLCVERNILFSSLPWFGWIPVDEYSYKTNDFTKRVSLWCKVFQANSFALPLIRRPCFSPSGTGIQRRDAVRIGSNPAQDDWGTGATATSGLHRQLVYPSLYWSHRNSVFLQEPCRKKAYRSKHFLMDPNTIMRIWVCFHFFFGSIPTAIQSMASPASSTSKSFLIMSLTSRDSKPGGHE